MRFEDSKYFELKHLKVEMPFGNFYFLETIIVSELNEGAHFDWPMVEIMMSHVIDLYGASAELGYVSNRINSYSIDPSIWEKEHEKYHIIMASAIVTYTKMSYLNASLEKKLTKKNIKRCISLDEGINWASNLRELKKNSS